jgi:hypothetical protein
MVVEEAFSAQAAAIANAYRIDRKHHLKYSSPTN